MFEKTLTDVVKGIRSSKRDSTAFISNCILEIKKEIHSSDMYVKANALQKLTFLQMMGYSLSWVDFATIEVMSSPRFFHKRIGYLAASQGFTEDTEVILLTTNLLKKELRGAIGAGMNEIYDAGLAINCMSNIVTEDLARDLLPELTNLTSHPNPYLRKKAILCLFKLFVKYPQGLRLTFPRLQQCLDDSNSCVVSCAVNVVTELSDKNPNNYLHLAPTFFELLNRSSNNWMLIKVVKLLGSLVAEEPRLARKLLDPLASIVKSTQAKSLLYESVHTITLCLPYCRKNDGSMPANVPDIVELCASTLLNFVKQPDQNLKYLGLVGFGSLMQSHPKVLSDPKYRPLILTCLSDEDITIRKRALDLLIGMVTRKNLVELVTQLLRHVELASGTYKHDLVRQILGLCAREKYSLIQDFCWYLDVIYQLGHTRGIEELGGRLREQFIDIALRVLPARSYVVRLSMEILLERELATSSKGSDDNGRGKHLLPDMLPAAAWVVGEYSAFIPEATSMKSGSAQADLIRADGSSKGIYHAIVRSLTNPSKSLKLDSWTLMQFVHSALKVCAAAMKDPLPDDGHKKACIETLAFNTPVFRQCTDPSVSDSATFAIQLLNALKVSADSDGSGFVESNKGNLIDIGGQASSLKTTKDKNILPRREAVDALSYLLIPSPIKPLGSKLQRKKHDSIDHLKSIELDSFYMDLLDKEKANAGQSVESVSFLQQRLLPPKSIATKASEPSYRPVAQSATPNPTVTSMYSAGTPTSQHQEVARNDPFYLMTNDQEVSTSTEPPSRFSTIQLLDSDQELDGKQRKKGKRKKPKKTSSHVSPDMSPFPSSFSGVVYDSDDEVGPRENTSERRKKKPGKEFASLARVDLTAEEPNLGPSASGRRKKKTKAGKRKKEKSEAPIAAVGDLLDLGGGGFMQPATTTTKPDTVFDLLDDFGGLSASVTTTGKSPPQPVVPTQQELLWLRADPRLTAAFPELTFAYRVVLQSSESANLALRVTNGSLRPVEGLSITIDGNQKTNISTIPPSQSSVLHFNCSLRGTRQINVAINLGEKSLPAVFVVPLSAYFSPANNLSLEQIARELSTSNWNTCSVKLSPSSRIVDPSRIKEDILLFFNAAVVAGGEVSANSATFAAVAMTGSSGPNPVRIMLKVKKHKAVKIDVKVQDYELAQALGPLLNALILA